MYISRLIVEPFDNHEHNKYVRSEACVIYCIGDNCMSSDCCAVSGNNPFCVDNIVNGISYNISVSLRNNFGQSGQTTALYSVESSFCYGHTRVYGFYLIRL